MKVVTDLNNILYYQFNRKRPSLLQNTYRKSIWSFLSDYPVASSITLTTQTTLWHQLYSGRGLTANLRPEHAEKKRCSLPSRHLILVYRLCHLCQEYPVEDIIYDPHASEGWCMLKKISDMYLQAPLWVLLPQDLLWDQFYPVERHIRVSFIHLIYTCDTNSLLLTISPLGPLNPCGPFSPASPWRRQMKHTQLFIDGTSPLFWL